MKLNIQKYSLIFTAFIVGLFFFFPFIWMFFATFKNNLEIFTPFPLLPQSFSFQYYTEVFSGKWIPFFRQYYNSLFISILETLGALLLSSFGGYVFGVYSFKGKNLLFLLAMLVILIPKQVMILPLFTWLNNLGLLDSKWGVIFPGIVSGIGVLYFTQVFKSIPKDLFQMARMEGLSDYKIFWVILPLISAPLLTYGLIHFILSWHQQVIPMVILNSAENRSLTISLSALYGGSMRIPYAMLMVGSLFSIFPTVILFFALRKQFRSTLSSFIN